MPIYDARLLIITGKSDKMSPKSTITLDFLFTSHSIKHIPSIYSTYYKGNEVPSGSLAMVGYVKPQCKECSSEVKDITDVGVFCSRYETGSYE